MNDILLKLSLKRSNCAQEQYKNSQALIYREMENGRTMEVIEGRKGVDFHYYLRKGVTEGIDIKMTHEVDYCRNSYYKLIK